MNQVPPGGSDDYGVIRPKQPEPSSSPQPGSVFDATTGIWVSSSPVEEVVKDTVVNPVSEEPVVQEDLKEEDDIVESNIDSEPLDEDENPNAINFPEDKIDLRGESLDDLRTLFEENIKQIGDEAVALRVRTVGTWENIVFRSFVDENYEELRNQEAISLIVNSDTSKPSERLKDPETGKTLLRTSFIGGSGPSTGEVKNVTGDEAVLAFENLRSGNTGATKKGGYRVVLYNSGITLDIVTPTGVDVQTMLTNCIRMDRELGASQGAHYFAYADQMYKAQLLSFIQPLIVNSSYTDWRKKGKLWTVMKLPDLTALVMYIAAMCYPEGYEGFITRCSRPVSEEHPEACRHTETLTANLFEMIVTRFSVIPKEGIDYLVDARMGKNKTNLTNVAKYQADLGLEGEKITLGDITYTMKIPSVAEHLDAGAIFLSDITNEIEADNNDARFSEVGNRYIRVFLPWIAKISLVSPNGGILETDDRRTIIRELERFDKDDVENLMRKAFREYIAKVQLTYVGYPALKCPSCGHSPDTPSGMMTFDPFSTFFILAFQYLNPSK